MITTRANPLLLDLGRYPLVVDLPTRYSDLDHNEHVNNVAMAAIFEEARTRFAITDGKGNAGGTPGQMIAAHNIEYLGQGRYPQDIQVGVGISAVGRSSWRFAVLAVQDGRPCGFSDAVLVLTDGQASIPLPDDLIVLLNDNMVRITPPPVVAVPQVSARANPELLDAARYPLSFTIPGRFADLDGNDHINNVAAAALLEDARMRFSHMAAPGSYMGGPGVPMIVAHNIDYLGQMHYPGSVVVHLAVLDIGRTSWRFLCFATQDGRPCMFAVAVMVMADGLRPMPIPDAIRSRLAEVIICSR